jgi:hypothetical protein
VTVQLGAGADERRSGARGSAPQPLGLPVRAAILLALPFLAACEYAFGVQRHAVVPPGLAFRELDAVLVGDPGYSAGESRPEEDYCLVRDGAVHATVSFDGGRVWVGSIWISRPPSEDVLDQSIELQRSLIQRMHRAVPALPSEEAWATEWVRMEAQQGAAAVEPERRGQGSPTQRTTRGE